jgi:MEMO1 family protein
MKEKGLGAGASGVRVLLISAAAVMLAYAAPLWAQAGGQPEPPPPSAESNVPQQSLQAAPAPIKIKPAVVAGRFYPASRAELLAKLDGYLGGAAGGELPGKLGALVVPHAGYEYSGPVAGAGYRAVGASYRRVILIASNHNAKASYQGFALPDFDRFETPLGQVKISALANELLARENFKRVPEAFDSHVVEVQLPFLQRRLSDFEILPIVTGAVGTGDLDKLADAIAGLMDDYTLLVVSSDLSHYHPYGQAVELDQKCIKSAAALSIAEAERCEACGLPGILTAMRLAKRLGWQGKIIEYKNSGDTSGLKDQVVGYSAIAFFEEQLGASDKAALLRLSRSVLEGFVREGKLPPVDEAQLPQRLRIPQGCFVTLKQAGELRGCIGRLSAAGPLYRCVVENTVNAAVNDNRFEPVAPGELGNIKIEVSVLTPPLPWERRGSEDLLAFLVPKKHGVILSRGLYQSTFLPQVWEDLPVKENFLTRLCLKGGMEAACWKDPATKVQTYEDVAFAE